MKKKTKSILDATLNKAISPPKKRDLSKLDSLLDEYTDSSRPQDSRPAVRTLQAVPSTILESERPQEIIPPSIENDIAVHKINNLPSTPETADVLPSTTQFLPSTKQEKTGNVDVLPPTLKKSAVKAVKELPSTKGDRHNKDLARYDNRINPQIKQRIDVFCAHSGLSQKEFAEQSAVHFIDVWTARLSKNVDGKTAHDDLSKMILGKTSPRVINLYRAYNPENKWKFKDDECGAQFNLVDLRVIELGMIETQFNSKFKKINSFTYYENEIENFLNQNLGEEMLNFLVTHYRIKWKTATGREIDFGFLED